jgi:hypothetical protein
MGYRTDACELSWVIILVLEGFRPPRTCNSSVLDLGCAWRDFNLRELSTSSRLGVIALGLAWRDFNLRDCLEGFQAPTSVSSWKDFNLLGGKTG